MCPNNREIRRLLARVEEECKQMQRALKQQGVLNQPSVSNNSDHEHEQDEDDDEVAENNLMRDLHDEQEESSPLDHRAEEWSQNFYSFNRTLPESNSPPAHRQSQRQHHRESVTHKSQIPQPTKQAQIIKTNQHLSSTCPGAKSLSSPLPARHTLKAGPEIDIGQSVSVSEDREHLPTTTAYHDGEGVPSSSLYVSSSCSRAPETLLAHSVSSLETLVLSSGPQGQEPRKESAPGAGAGSGSQPGSMRVSSSTSSLASSSSLSDSGKLQGPDVRTKTSVDRNKEYKPRPFMGIMDKTARFQQQQQQHLQAQQSMSRPWPSHPGPGTSYTEQLKSSVPGAALGSLHNGSLLCSAFSDQFGQSKPAVSVAHSYTDSKPSHPSLTRDNPAIHVAAMKPKRSFIESNV